MERFGIWLGKSGARKSSVHVERSESITENQKQNGTFKDHRGYETKVFSLFPIWVREREITSSSPWLPDCSVSLPKNTAGRKSSKNRVFSERPSQLVIVSKSFWGFKVSSIPNTRKQCCCSANWPDILTRNVCVWNRQSNLCLLVVDAF